MRKKMFSYIMKRSSHMNALHYNMKTSYSNVIMRVFSYRSDATVDVKSDFYGQKIYLHYQSKIYSIKFSKTIHNVSKRNFD